MCRPQKRLFLASVYTSRICLSIMLRAGRALSESSRCIARRLLPEVLALCTCSASVIIDIYISMIGRTPLLMRGLSCERRRRKDQMLLASYNNYAPHSHFK